MYVMYESYKMRPEEFEAKQFTQPSQSQNPIT